MRYLLPIIIALLALVLYSVIGSCVQTDRLYEIYEHTDLTELAGKGDEHLKAHNPDSALIYYSMVNNKLTDKSPDTLRMVGAKSLASQGYIYLFYKNDYASSYASYLQALDVLDNLNDSTLYPDIYLNLGNIYLDYREDDKMLDYYKKAFMSSVKVKDWRTMRIAFTELLATVISDNKAESVSEEIKVFDTLELPDSSEFTSLKLMRESVRALAASDYTEAIACLRRAKAQSDMGLIQNRYGVLCDIQVVTLLNHQGKHDEATSILREILANNSGEMDIKNTAYKLLSDTYTYKNNADSILKYHRLSTATADSMFRSQQYGLIRDIGLNHDLSKLDSKIKIIETEKNATRRALIITSVALAIIIGLVVVVFFQNRKLRQRNLDLFKHNTQVLARESKERSLRSLYEKQIEDLKLQVDSMRATLMTGIDVGTPGEESLHSVDEDTENAEFQSANKKYQNSHLSETMQAELLSKIDGVLANEDEILSNDFSLDRLASLVASNTSYVSQIINDIYGKNFQNLLGETRIKLACHRLCDKKYDHLTIEAIALDLGFKSRTNFISVFKKTTGLTPSEYRKINKVTDKSK